MKAVRIRLTQPSAHYHKPDSVENKMTYPLPFPSTVIGAMHAVCGYTTFHNMDVSIQGRYSTLQQKLYVDHCYFNSTEPDRGNLVKVPNGSLLSSSFISVAASKKQGSHFQKGIDIEVKDEPLLEEYRCLLEKKTQIDNEKSVAVKSLESEIKKLKAEKKLADKGRKIQLEKTINDLNNKVESAKLMFKKRKTEEYEAPFNYFKNVVKSTKYYEILYDVELTIHIRAEEAVLNDIVNNIDNFQCLGRSEDFVNVLECKIVELSNDMGDGNIDNNYSMYVHKDDLERYIYSLEAVGTKYYATKRYHFEEGTGRRIFEKIPVVLVTGVTLGFDEIEDSDRVFVDYIDEENKLLVDFL